MKMIVLEDPRARLERHPNPDECWLLCEECRRFFRYTSALPFSRYEHDACPFSDCYGSGVGHHLFLWDDLREPDDPRWPTSTDELEHGMRAPDMEPFYEAQLRSRIDRLVCDFEESREAVERLDGEASRFVRVFLKMMADLCWDLTDEALGFPYDARNTVAELPVWSRTREPAEIPRMLAELRAFFAFARRSSAIEDAEQWLALVEDDDLLADRLRYTMETDSRLRPRRYPKRRRKKRRRRQRRR